MTKSLEKLLSCFSGNIIKAVKNIPAEVFDNLCEIRVRADKPIVLSVLQSKFFLSANGEIKNVCNGQTTAELITATSDEVKNSFLKLCEFSVYKRQTEINNGFITVGGGHRIGICGTCNIVDNNIRSVTDLTSLNVRIAKEFTGCANDLMSKISYSGGVLLCGVPSSGKTTLLRDLSRQLSLKGYTVSLIDERFEISASCSGTPHFDIGLCDVYSGYPKNIAIPQAIRSMSPDYIICDELTGDDVNSVKDCVNFGVKMIATVHCDNAGNLMKNKGLVQLISTGVFGKIVFLDTKAKCKIADVIDTGVLKIA